MEMDYDTFVTEFLKYLKKDSKKAIKLFIIKLIFQAVKINFFPINII